MKIDENMGGFVSESGPCGYRYTFSMLSVGHSDWLCSLTAVLHGAQLARRGGGRWSSNNKWLPSPRRLAQAGQQSRVLFQEHSIFPLHVSGFHLLLLMCAQCRSQRVNSNQTTPACLVCYVTKMKLYIPIKMCNREKQPNICICDASKVHCVQPHRI